MIFLLDGILLHGQYRQHLFIDTDSSRNADTADQMSVANLWVGCADNFDRLSPQFIRLFLLRWSSQPCTSDGH